MDLDQLRKQAKERVRATPSLKLADAQHAIAREQGFASWPKLKAYVDRGGVQQPFRDDLDYYAERAYGLLASAQDGTPSAVAEFTQQGQPLSRAGARAAVAASHGFSGWQALAHHLRGLSGEPFAQAFRLIEERDADRLAAHLDRYPDLLSRKGTNGNDLLGLAAGSCDERLVRVVLDRGADPSTANAHGWTALHQAGYSNLPWMARLLLDAGASPDVHGRGDGGTPLVAALFWGHRKVAKVLASSSLAPGNLRVAAGLDRVDLLPHASAGHRGFYRPHSGFPAWTPGSSRQEALDEAVAWAARNGSTKAMEWLVQHGARTDKDVYRGTPLIWAAWRGRDEAVRWLLAAGAGVNQRATFGGPSHGQGVTALHMAAEAGRATTVDILLDAGADRSLTDDLYNSTPAGWADHGGHPELPRLLS